MILDTVSADTMRSAQMITGIAMAIWIGIGVVPPWRKYTQAVRATVLVLYLLGCIGFIVYVVLGNG